MKSLVILCCSLLVGLSAATAHTHSYSYSETREINLPFSGSLDAETMVGAIIVTSWENDYVLVRAHISTSSFYNEYDARLIAGRWRSRRPLRACVSRGPPTSRGAWASTSSCRAPRPCA